MLNDFYMWSESALESLNLFAGGGKLVTETILE